MIAPSTSIAERPHRVVFRLPGDPVPDGSGGYRDGEPTDLGEVYVRIEPARGADAERVAPGTVLSHSSVIVTGPYLTGLTTRAQMEFIDSDGRTRLMNVMGLSTREERGGEMVLVCGEIIR